MKKIVHVKRVNATRLMKKNNTLRTWLLAVMTVMTGCNTADIDGDASILNDERFPTPVELTASDIEWFRDFAVGWIFAESGSPAIILPDLTVENHFKLYEGDAPHQATLLKFERVFMSFAVYAQLTPGTYALNTARIMGDVPEGLSVKPEFELTRTHIALIRNAWWRQGFIDYKYPYGNYRYYEADMALKLGEFVPKNKRTGVFELSDAEQKKYQTLHHELLLAMLTFVQHAQINPGHYQLPVGGWDKAFMRLQPPTEQQVSSYVKNAVTLKHRLANARGEGESKGDNVIDWIKLHDDFSNVID